MEISGKTTGNGARDHASVNIGSIDAPIFWNKIGHRTEQIFNFDDIMQQAVETTITAGIICQRVRQASRHRKPDEAAGSALTLFLGDGHALDTARMTIGNQGTICLPKETTRNCVAVRTGRFNGVTLLDTLNARRHDVKRRVLRNRKQARDLDDSEQVDTARSDSISWAGKARKPTCIRRSVN